MSVAFIIPHMGREEMLIQTLTSIAQLDDAGHAVEVHVATKNHTLNLPKYLHSLNLLVHHRPMDETISHQRNYGAQQSQAEYLAFLDADIQLSNNWLSVLLELLQDEPTRVLVSAVQVCEQDAPPLEKIRTALSNAHVDCAVRFLPGRNLLLSRTTFEQVGGFPEHLITCEDYYFTDQVHALGELYYSSHASYVHLGEDKELKEMYRKEIWRGQSNLQSIKGRKVPLSELPSFLVPVWILLFALATCVAAITGQWLISVASAVCLMTPIMLYTLRLYHIAKPAVSFSDVLRFYMYYFPARVIGTFRGAFQTIGLK